MFVVVVKGGYVCVLLGFYFCLYLANVGLVGVKQRWVRLRFSIASLCLLLPCRRCSSCTKAKVGTFAFLLVFILQTLFSLL